jgi:hypothetical protein
MKLPFILPLVCCIGFLVMGTWQAPWIRACLSFALGLLSEYLGWGWTKFHCLLFSTSLALLLNPTWVISLSLLHSCGCALAMMASVELCHFFCPQGSRPKKLLFNFVVSYFLTMPFLWGWANVDPLALTLGALLGLPLGIFWFLNSMLALVLPHTVGPLLNFAAQVQFDILSPLQQILTPSEVQEPAWNPMQLWTYLALLGGFAFELRKHQRQSS